jgi:hypothetical protein
MVIMGNLTFAKTIADNPSAFINDQLRVAHEYLSALSTNGGVRNSERAKAKLKKRLAAIEDMLSARGGSLRCPHCGWGLAPRVLQQHINEKHSS